MKFLQRLDGIQLRHFLQSLEIHGYFRLAYKQLHDRIYLLVKYITINNFFRLMQMLFSLSVLTTIFPGGPGLASFIEAKDDGSGATFVVTTGATRCAKLLSIHHHNENQRPIFYRPDALPVT